MIEGSEGPDCVVSVRSSNDPRPTVSCVHVVEEGRTMKNYYSMSSEVINPLRIRR